MKTEQVIETLYGEALVSEVPADEIDETVQSPALLAREAAALMLEDVDDVPITVCEAETGFAVLGTTHVVFISNEGDTDIDALPQVDEAVTRRGMGVGGTRQGTGGTDTCECPKCGATAPHARGTPCSAMKCPKCGAVMQGANDEGAFDELITVEGAHVETTNDPDEDAVAQYIGDVLEAGGAEKDTARGYGWSFPDEDIAAVMVERCKSILRAKQDEDAEPFGESHEYETDEYGEPIFEAVTDEYDEGDLEDEVDLDELETYAVGCMRLTQAQLDEYAALKRDDPDTAALFLLGLAEEAELGEEILDEYKKMARGAIARRQRSAKKLARDPKHKRSLLKRRKKLKRNVGAKMRAKKYAKKFAKRRVASSADDGGEMIEMQMVGYAAEKADAELVVNFARSLGLDAEVITFTDEDYDADLLGVDLTMPQEFDDMLATLAEIEDDDEAEKYLDEMIGNPWKGKMGKLKVTRFTGSGALKSNTAKEESEGEQRHPFLSEGKRTTYTVRTERGQKSNVLRRLKAVDKSAVIDPESNPITFWITTTLPQAEIASTAGVEDVIKSKKQESVDEALKKTQAIMFWLSDAGLYTVVTRTVKGSFAIGTVTKGQIQNQRTVSAFNHKPEWGKRVTLKSVPKALVAKARAQLQKAESLDEAAGLKVKSKGEDKWSVVGYDAERGSNVNVMVRMKEGMRTSYLVTGKVDKEQIKQTVNAPASSKNAIDSDAAIKDAVGAAISFHQSENEDIDEAKRRKRRKVSGKKPQFFYCGGCDQYHPKGWTGDCRDDAHRFNADDLDDKYGSLGWEEVDESIDEEQRYLFLSEGAFLKYWDGSSMEELVQTRLKELPKKVQSEVKKLCPDDGSYQPPVRVWKRLSPATRKALDTWAKKSDAEDDFESVDEAKYDLKKLKHGGAKTEDWYMVSTVSGKVLGFLSKYKPVPGETHPWKAFAPIVGQGPPRFGKMIGTYYKKDGGKKAALAALAKNESTDEATMGADDPKLVKFLRNRLMRRNGADTPYRKLKDGDLFTYKWRDKIRGVFVKSGAVAFALGTFKEEKLPQDQKVTPVKRMDESTDEAKRQKKGILYAKWTEGYNVKKITAALKKAGATKVWTDTQYGWSNQPDVVLFTGLSDKEAEAAMEKVGQRALVYSASDDWGESVDEENVRGEKKLAKIWKKLDKNGRAELLDKLGLNPNFNKPLASFTTGEKMMLINSYKKFGESTDEAIMKSLSVPQRHQLSIAKKTLKMSDAGAKVMGGMNKKEARAFLKSVGYTDRAIAKMEEDTDDAITFTFPHARLREFLAVAEKAGVDNDAATVRVVEGAVVALVDTEAGRKIEQFFTGDDVTIDIVSNE